MNNYKGIEKRERERRERKWGRKIGQIRSLAHRCWKKPPSRVDRKSWLVS